MWGEGTPGKNRGPRGDKAVLQEPGSQYRGCAAESDRGLALSRHQRAGREELVRGGGWALGAGSGAQAVELPQPTPQLHGGQPNWAWPQTTNLCFWVARGLPVWPRPCREEPRGSPRPHATAVPRTPPPSQAFWKPPPPNLRGPQDGSPAIAGGATWWWWVGGGSHAGTVHRLNFSGVHSPPK